MLRACALIAAIAGRAAAGPTPDGDACARRAPHRTPTPDEAASASALFEEGRTLAKQGDFAAACDKFVKSLELDHALGTELNLAECIAGQGKSREAWKMFVEAEGDASCSNDQMRIEYAHKRATELVAKLATVVVKIPHPDQPGLTVSIGGQPATPAAEIRQVVEPGTIEVKASAPNTTPFSTAAKLEANTTTIIAVQVPEMIVRSIDGDGGPRRRSRVYLAAGIAGAGAIVGGVSIALIAKAKSDYNATKNGPNCQPDEGGFECNTQGNADIAKSQSLADKATYVAIGSGVVLVGAAFVYFTAPRDSSVTVAPMAGAGVAGAVLSGRF